MLSCGRPGIGRVLFNIDRQRKLSLYLHVPFCKRKCSYCAFFSKTGCSPLVIEGYVRKLIGEVVAVSDWYGMPFDTVFIGGGNPGVLGSQELLGLCRACCRNGHPREFTVEMNPESMAAAGGDWLRSSLEYIDRVSIGVQSLDADVLAVLGRNSSLEETLAGIDVSQRLRREFGFSLGYDLMACVPGRQRRCVEDIGRLFEIADFDHLSLYSLMIEPGTGLSAAVERGELQIVDDDSQAQILIDCWREIESRGMFHYEVSNFAMPGSECRHNLAYWRMEQYIGLGPGAASTAFDPYTRIECPADLGMYVESPPLSGYRQEVLGRREQVEEWVIMGTRIREGLSSDECLRRFGTGLPELSYPGFVCDGKRFFPTEEGFLLADGAACYAAERILAAL